MEIKDAQIIVKEFAEQNGWKDVPNIDKLDHLHEELVEISQHLRYKSEKERIAFVEKHNELFMEEMGDLFFGLIRLANQLDVDLEEGFINTKEKVFEKYKGKSSEHNVPWKKEKTAG